MSELKPSDETRPTKIWVSSKRTINTGNYESAAFEAGIEVELAPGEPIGPVFNRAHETCQKEIIKAAMKAGVVKE